VAVVTMVAPPVMVEITVVSEMVPILVIHPRFPKVVHLHPVPHLEVVGLGEIHPF